MTNKSSSRLALKLLLPLGAAIIFLIVSVIVTYSQVNVVRREIRTLQQEKVVVMELAQDIRFNVLHTSEIFTDMSAVKDLEGMEEAAEIKAELEASVKELVQILPNEKDNWDHILEEYNVFYDTCNRMKDAYINKGQDAGNELMEEVDPITEKLSTEVDEYSEKVSSEMEEYIAEIEDNANTIVLIFIFTSLIVFALIIATTVIVFVQVIKPIISVTKSINELAVQNLATEELNIKNKDEIGDLANSNNKLLNSMRDIVKELNSSADVMDRLSGEMKNNADIVTGSMTDIAEAVGGIATNASDQASDIERTMEEIQSLQNIIATNETTSENLALASKEIAKASTEGSEVIEDLYSVTKESEVAFSAVFDSIQKIIESTQHIKQASNMIESIATQTNLLSLNASIEAARAGDMGKGFAVVADEIRTLSDGSRASVEEINKMLIELEQNVDNAGEQSESIKLAVEKQVAGVETTREKYSNIANSLSTINDEISSLGDISKSLAHSCKIVGEIMNSLASSAEENAASTEETNASVEEVLAMMHGIEENSLNIREISEKLQGQVALYKL